MSLNAEILTEESNCFKEFLHIQTFISFASSVEGCILYRTRGSNDKVTTTAYTANTIVAEC